MSFDFEVIERSMRQIHVEPSVSLTTLGRLTFNKPVTTMFLERRITRVLLLWDERAKVIGLRPASPKDKNGYAVSHNPSKSNSSVSARSLFERIGVDYSETVSAPVTIYQSGTGPATLTFEVPERMLRAKTKAKHGGAL